MFDLASEQYGYFTTAQAARCGYAPDMLTYHVKQGNFRRAHRGMYRFRDFPFSPARTLWQPGSPSGRMRPWSDTRAHSTSWTSATSSPMPST
ncbi:MAG: type IV toxin-antitoxin system AbiEi family antitoxin domain-containing protein [Chloroflexi bacterium]|nr:type IV toxin-antitoxin system AbiEi family antitoxin domain-containing protein [Chloroflexota bacterium]